MEKHYQDKQMSTNNQHQAELRLLKIWGDKQDERIRELEFAVQKLLKTVFGIMPKYKFVVINETFVDGEKHEQQ